MKLEELLKLCRYAAVESYDERTHTYKIPKYSKPIYEIGKCYLVELSKDIVGNENSVMATNWNHGRAPKCGCMKICVSKALGQNVYVDGIGYDKEKRLDLDEIWSGWLNVQDLTQLMKL